MSNSDTFTQIKGYRYRIEQTDKGVRITVCGNAIDEIVADYTRLKVKLESEGFKITPEE